MGYSYHHESRSLSGEQSAHRGESSSRHRRRRGHVMPLDHDETFRPEGSRRRRRRRRSRGLGGLEIFIGLSALWTVLVVGAIMIEALGGQSWFFVSSKRAAQERAGPAVVLEDALSLDSTQRWSAATGRDTRVLVSGGRRRDTEMRWGRVTSVLLSVPMLYLTWRIYRRLRRARRRDAA